MIQELRLLEESYRISPQSTKMLPARICDGCFSPRCVVEQLASGDVAGKAGQLKTRILVLQGFLDLEVSMYSCQELSEMFYRIMPSVAVATCHVMN